MHNKTTSLFKREKYPKCGQWIARTKQERKQWIGNTARCELARAGLGKFKRFRIGKIDNYETARTFEIRHTWADAFRLTQKVFEFSLFPAHFELVPSKEREVRALDCLELAVSVTKPYEFECRLYDSMCTNCYLITMRIWSILLCDVVWMRVMCALKVVRVHVHRERSEITRLCGDQLVIVGPSRRGSPMLKDRRSSTVRGKWRAKTLAVTRTSPAR